MRIGIVVTLSAVLVQGAAAQFDQLAWTLKGDLSGSGNVTSDMLHVVGPDGGSCWGSTTWFETVAPWAATVSVVVDYITLDTWPSYKYFDAPAWVVDGDTLLASSPTPGWFDGTYEMEFEVLPGQAFGFGIWSQDCIEGPGVGDFRDLVIVPHEWTVVGNPLDPQAGPVVSGTYVDAAGDHDGDGQADVVVGRSLDLHGFVSVVSGSSGKKVLDLTNLPHEVSAVAGVGDLDGDGVPDVLVGASQDDLPKNSGAVYAYSGQDGVLLFDKQGTVKKGALGSSIDGVGDLDGDGVPDVIAGAPGDAEEAFVLRGIDGQVLLHLEAGTAGSAFGVSVRGLGDVDLDGVPDVAVGAAGAEGVLDEGTARVFSGATGAVLASFSAAHAGYAYAVAPAGDLDADGRPDLLVGDPGHVQDGLRTGRISALSVVGGHEILAILGNSDSDFAFTLDGGQDLSTDGIADILGSEMEPTGAALIAFDGATGRRFFGSTPVGGGFEFGSVAIVGNVDATGAADAALALASKKEVRVHKALESLGPPVLEAGGHVAGNEQVVLRVRDAAPGVAAWLVLGATGLQLPLLGGVLYPHPDLIFPLPILPDGTAEAAGRWPLGLPKFTSAWAQAWIPDPAGPDGWTCTNGLIGTQLGP